MISIMTILRQNKTNDGKIFRLVENTYRDDAVIFDILSVKQPVIPRLRDAGKAGRKVCSVHPMFLFFWITIKSYNHTFDAEMNSDEVSKEIDYNKFLAEEYYEFIINN